MSREELAAAYADGSISRRTFIRRLVATGVSLSAAVTYATVLSPSAASAATRRDRRDLYEHDHDFYRRDLYHRKSHRGDDNGGSDCGDDTGQSRNG